MTDQQTRGTVQCDHCGATHAAYYSHEGQYGEGRIFAVVCSEDDLTDYYTSERVTLDEDRAGSQSGTRYTSSVGHRLTVAAIYTPAGSPINLTTHDSHCTTCQSAIALEAYCTRCRDTFNPADEDDLIHVERIDGEPCGGRGELVGQWR